MTRRSHTTRLHRCSRCGVRDTVTATVLDVEECLHCLAQSPNHAPRRGINSPVIIAAFEELRLRGEDCDGRETRPLPNYIEAQEIVDEVAPRIHATVQKLRGVARYMELGTDRDNLLVYIDELAQCATMLTLAAPEGGEL